MKKSKYLLIMVLIIIIGNCNKEKKHYNPANNNQTPKPEEKKETGYPIEWVKYTNYEERFSLDLLKEHGDPILSLSSSEKYPFIARIRFLKTSDTYKDMNLFITKYEFKEKERLSSQNIDKLVEDAVNENLVEDSYDCSTINKNWIGSTKKEGYEFNIKCIKKKINSEQHYYSRIYFNEKHFYVLKIKVDLVEPLSEDKMFRVKHILSSFQDNIDKVN